MKKSLFIVLATFLLGVGTPTRANESFSLKGNLSATDQEADEGYFAIGQETMIVVKPKSDLHTYLRGQVGKRIRIIVEPIYSESDDLLTK